MIFLRPLHWCASQCKGANIVWCTPLLEVYTHDPVLALCMHPLHLSALCCTAAPQLQETHQAKP
jgi:hypothetical protein